MYLVPQDTCMDPEFIRIRIFSEDYWKLNKRFGENEVRPKQGVLVNRALKRIDELENEITAMNKVLQENVK